MARPEAEGTVVAGMVVDGREVEVMGAALEAEEEWWVEEAGWEGEEETLERVAAAEVWWRESVVVLMAEVDEGVAPVAAVVEKVAP